MRTQSINAALDRAHRRPTLHAQNRREFALFQLFLEPMKTDVCANDFIRAQVLGRVRHRNTIGDTNIR